MRQGAGGLLGLFVADDHDAAGSGDVGRAHDLGVGQSGKEREVVLVNGKDIAEEIACGEPVHGAVQLVRTTDQFAVQSFYNVTNGHHVLSVILWSPGDRVGMAPRRRGGCSVQMVEAKGESSIGPLRRGPLWGISIPACASFF